MMDGKGGNVKTISRLDQQSSPRYDICHTGDRIMRTAKIAITLDRQLLERLDELVHSRRFPSRSRVLQEALRDKLDRLDRGRLARECSNLDPKFEQGLAEEGLNGEPWPEY
jgi:Arc/MetJ-type ribon-helix-helix transcriptional regulator